MPTLRRLLPVALTLLLCVVLLACDLQLPRPTSAPATPPAPPTVALPTVAPPTPTPNGPMPQDVARLDLGLPGGDGYYPYAAAVEGDMAYVLCQRVEDAEGGPVGLAVVDVSAGRTLRVWPLEGWSGGPMAAAAGRALIPLEGEEGLTLAAIDPRTGRTVASVGSEYIRTDMSIAVDEARERVYVPEQNRLVVRHARTLEVLAEMAYLGADGERHLALDAAADRLYLTAGAGLYAYRASDLAPLWQSHAPVVRILNLVLDASGGYLLAHAVTEEGTPTTQAVLIYSADGAPVGQVTPQERSELWLLAWADAVAGRIVFQSYDYGSLGAPVAEFWVADWSGATVVPPGRWPDARVLAPARSDRLYLLGWRDHRLTRLRAATLEVDRRVTLGVELAHLAVVEGGRRLWVNTTASDLVEIDAAAADSGQLVVARRLPGAGAGGLLLDGPAGLLLAAEAEGDPQRVSVVDLERWSVRQVITGGAEIALDTRRARALVGARSGTYPPQQGAVQVWDLLRGERVGEVPLGGPPAYNPLRDEIVIAGYGAQAFDADTLAAKRSLTPDIDTQTCKGCTGQPAAVGVTVAPEVNLLALEMTITSAGKGPGTLPAPRFFALDTLAPVSHTASYWETCGGDLVLWPPVEGRIVHSTRFSRYTFYANTFVHRADDGALLGWRDGLAVDLLSPDGRIAYDRRGDAWLAVDTRDWQPLGSAPFRCIHGYDREANRYYALDGSDVIVLAPRWAEPLPPRAPERGGPQATVRALQLSPSYAQDETLFAVDDLGLYRSRDGGESWVDISAGLPALDARYGLHLALAVSPDYARDRTLLVGGWLGGYEGASGGSEGLGVWRSSDGGETWQPAWRDLTHLNVETLAISPAFAQDGALLAYCRYVDLRSGETGRSLFRSDDRGESWRLVDQLSQSAPVTATLPAPEDVLAPVRGQATGEGVRVGMGGAAIERLVVGEWVTALRLPQGEYIVDVQSSPAGTTYMLTDQALYRSQDGGGAWERASAAPLDGRTFERRFTALAVAPDGDEAVYLGDAAGGVARLSVADVRWVALAEGVSP